MKKQMKWMSVLLSIFLLSSCNDSIISSSTESSSGTTSSTFVSSSSLTPSLGNNEGYDDLSVVATWEKDHQVHVKAVVNGMKGRDLYISDNTGSFFVYNNSSISTTCNIGDIVEIDGKIGVFDAAGISQILPTSIKVVGKTNPLPPVVIQNVSEIDQHRFAPISVYDAKVMEVKSSTGDSSLILNLNGTNVTLFASKKLANKSKIDAFFQKLKVNQLINVIGGFADYYKTAQIVVTEVEQLQFASLTYEEKLALVTEELNQILKDIDKHSFTKDIPLPTSLSYGATVTWSSNQPKYCTAQGAITRPEIGKADVEVTLSYAIVLEQKTSASKTIKVTILAKKANEEEYNYTHVEPSYTGTYYNNISQNLMDTALLNQLYQLLDSTYNPTISGYGNLWSIFPYSDADPKNPNNGKIISFYSGNASTRSNMNKEHVWPNSRGGGIIEGDAHMVRPTIISENSARGNDFFNENGKWDPASFNNPKYRGIAARIIFYCAVKKKDNLSLVDKETDATISKQTGTMGKLSTLLKWNLEYEIDDSEILRNDVLYERFKYCRNPFIDDRNYACRIWGSTNSTTKNICGMR